MIRKIRSSVPRIGTRLALFATLVSIFFVIACGSMTLVVSKDGPGDTILQYNGFLACGGTQFKITITQNGKTISPTGAVGGGTLKFSGLKDVDPSQIVTISIEVVGEKACGKFMVGVTYSTGPIILTTARDAAGQPLKDTYILDVDKFK